MIGGSKLCSNEVALFYVFDEKGISVDGGWLSALLLVGLSSCLLTIPGAMIGYVAGLRGTAVLVVSPLASAFVVVTAPYITAGWMRWSWLALGIWFGTLLVFAYLTGRAFRAVSTRNSLTESASSQMESEFHLTNWKETCFTVGIVALVSTWGIAQGMVDPSLPTQTWDGIFHLSGVRALMDSGVGTVEGLAEFTGNTNQPAGWHAFVSLISVFSDDPILGANSLSIAINAVVWPIVASVLAHVAFPSMTTAPIFSAILAGSAVAFPATTSTYGVLWPMTLGYALVPPLLALTLLIVQSREFACNLLLATFFFLGVVAAVLIHPQAVLAFVVLGTWILIGALIRLVGEWRSTRRSIKVVIIGAAIILVIGIGAVFRGWGPAMNRWVKAGEGGMAAELWGALSDSQLRGYGALSNSHPNYVLVMGLLFGVICVIVNWKGFWILGAFFSAVFLYLAQSVENFRGKRFLDAWLSLWYGDAPRLGAIIPLVAVPLAGAGLAYMSSRIILLLRMRSSVTLLVALGAAGVILATGILSRDARAERFAYAYSYSGKTGLNGWVSPDELSMIRQLKYTLGSDARVVGDPASGVSLAYVMGGPQSVYLYLNQNSTELHRYLSEEFSNLLEDPSVCERLNSEGIEYFYQDSNLYWINPGVTEQPELNLQPEVLQEMEIVAQGGTATVYRLTPCQ